MTGLHAESGFPEERSEDETREKIEISGYSAGSAAACLVSDFLCPACADCIPACFQTGGFFRRHWKRLDFEDLGRAWKSQLSCNYLEDAMAGRGVYSCMRGGGGSHQLLSCKDAGKNQRDFSDADYCPVLDKFSDPHLCMEGVSASGWYFQENPCVDWFDSRRDNASLQSMGSSGCNDLYLFAFRSASDLRLGRKI